MKKPGYRLTTGTILVLLGVALILMGNALIWQMLDFIRAAPDTVSLDGIIEYTMLSFLWPLSGFVAMVAGIYLISTRNRYVHPDPNEPESKEWSQRTQRLAMRIWAVVVVALPVALYLTARTDLYWAVACVIASIVAAYGFVLSFTKKYANEEPDHGSHSQTETEHMNSD